MNKTLAEAQTLAESISILLKREPVTRENLSVVLAPPYVFLESVGRIISTYPRISLGAQNCHPQPAGAFTGEVSVPMLKELNCSYVIIGHSERRTYFKETDAFLTEKVNAALTHAITPIFCCGEQLKDREESQQEAVVKAQLEKVLFQLGKEEIKKVVIAYEPVWAIGTGVTATAAQAQEMHTFIRHTLEKAYDSDTADKISILYGGSCNAKNAAELFAMPDIDGGLIGGASLIADDFVKIIHAMNSR